MRKLLFILTALVALAVASPAAADTVQVVIRDTGFQPAAVTVEFGDVVTWVNEGKVNHQVEANNGAFSSPVLRYKSEYSHRFIGPGTIAYRDPLNPSLRGSVTVKDPAPPLSGIEIQTSQERVLFGNTIVVSGAISGEFGAVGNQSVEVYKKPFGQASFVLLGVSRTDADGYFKVSDRPTILTTYYARWVVRKVDSDPTRISVRPRVTIAYNRVAKRFTTRLVGIQARTGRFVYLQRLTPAGRWVIVKKATVGLGNRAIFGARLPTGSFRYRILLTINQAGPGYLSGQSGTLLIGIKR